MGSDRHHPLGLKKTLEEDLPCRSNLLLDRPFLPGTRASKRPPGPTKKGPILTGTYGAVRGFPGGTVGDFFIDLP